MTYNNNDDSASKKIEGKFYPMRLEEHIKVCRELTATQRDVFYYIKTLAPSAEDQLNTSIEELAAALELSPRTVSKALKALKQLGWIDMEKIGLSKN